MNPAVAAAAPERQAFYAQIGAHNMAPLWESLHALVTPTPQTPSVPAIWHYEAARPFLMAAGRLITAKEAERRVLIFTGTPAGVGPVRPGDKLVGTIDGLRPVTVTIGAPD